MANNPSQGLNLGGQPQAYGDTFSALDLMHGADAWLTSDTSGNELRGAVTVDAKGWPTGLPVINGAPHGIWANIFYTKLMPATNFIVEWQGDGTVDLGPHATKIGHNKYRVAYSPDYSHSDDGLTIGITETDPNHTGNYIRNMKVYQEKYSDLVAAGEHFDPNWFQAVDDYRVLRMHDWQGTNYSKVTDWVPQDESIDHAFWVNQNRGMPYQLLVEMANQTKSDLWINIPHMATDTYMREAAAYVKQHLNSHLRVYVEYTNEYWSEGFDQHQYLIDKGKQMFGDATFANAEAYGARASEMTKIFRQVFAGDEARLFPTVTLNHEAFSTKEAITMLTTPDYGAQGGVSPLQAGIKYLATDGYFSWFNTDPSTDKMVDGWMKQGTKGYDAARDFLINQINTNLKPAWAKGHTLADKFHLGFGTYEGGALLINGNDPGGPSKYTAFNERVQLSPQMKQVYEAALAAWQKTGGGPFAWYSDVGRVGYWGDYGLWNAPDFKPEHRTEAIIAANQSIEPWWTGDNRPASTFDNGKYDAGTSGADTMTGTHLGDRLYGLSGNDTMFGLSGYDRLVGGGGRDTLSGGAGNDVLLGGAGDDHLSGGTGADVFYLCSGRDTISDWREGDHIAVKSVGLTHGDPSSVTIHQQGTNVLLELVRGSATWSLVLEHTRASTISIADDFLV
jgi:RTX calcium-binding nonapeptide repeat (4 copies)